MNKRIVDFTGTVSEGTMRQQDLIPAFMNVLADYDYPTYYSIRSMIIQSAGISHLVLADSDSWWTTQDASLILNGDIWDAMNNLAPDGYYFGSHPGDGSDYGYWKVEDDM